MQSEAKPAMRLVPLFAMALGFLALFFHPNLFLNDEVAQVASLDALSNGHLWLDPPPPGFDPFLQGLYRHGAVPTEVGSHWPPSGSTLLNVLALPILFVLKGIGAVVGVRGALSVAPASLVGWGLWEGLAILGRTPRQRIPWLIGGAAAFVPFLPAPALPAAPYLEIAAIHLVGNATTAAAAVLLYDMLRRHVGDAGALATGAVYLLGTPALFWGLNAKYHALTLFFATAAAWAYWDGGRTRPWRTFLAFAATGLAWWNKPGLGALQLGALGLVALPALRLGFKPVLARAGAAAAGFGLAILPDLSIRFAKFEMAAKTLVAAATPEGGNVALGQVAHHNFSKSLFSSFGEAADAIFQTVVWTRWQDAGAALSILSVSPIAALAVAALVRPARRQGLPPSLVWLAGLYTGLLLVLVGKLLVNQGAGYDMRYAATLWPFLLILCAPSLARLVNDRGPAWVARGALAGAASLVAATLLINLFVHALGLRLTPQGHGFDHTVFFRVGGLATAAALLGAFLVPAAARWRDWLLATAISFGLGAQAVILLTLSNPVGSAPFSMWLMEALSAVAKWMMRTH